MKKEEVIVVFTAKSIETILEEGGTSSWRLDRNHARQCSYAVCTRNAYAEWVQGPEEHHSAFLVGKVKDVVPSPSYEGRYLILFSEFARVNIPEVWKNDRNPVRYSSVEDLEIDFGTLEWEAMPELTVAPKQKRTKTDKAVSLTIEEAKRGLAQTFGIKPEAVEITIRG